MLPKIEVKCPTPNRAEIWVDGHKLPGVRDISLYMPLGEVPYVAVEIITDDLTFDGAASIEVKVKDVVAEEAYLSDIVSRVIRAISARAGSR